MNSPCVFYPLLHPLLFRPLQSFPIVDFRLVHVGSAVIVATVVRGPITQGAVSCPLQWYMFAKYWIREEISVNLM